MERKEFLGKICGGLTFTCVASMMAACSKDEATSGTTPGNTTPTPGGNTNNALITVNLLSQMVSVNDFVAEKGVIVVRIATGNAASSFSAFSSVCPHAGATVTYVSLTKTFNCAAHGSNFSSSGSVTQGPASSGLTKLSVEVTGSTLTVKG
jgi:Rieske Fe-S protein